MRSNKRRRSEGGSIHPRNKYAEKPPDFGVLASEYPSFKPFVFYSRDGRPRIDWTDYNSTRELTRVLLLHDHALNWWIPDGQLCPTVPNRSNYIHWIDDLLSSDIVPKNRTNGDVVRGFDIGTGANCIYPLLGAALLGWSFVGSDVTEVALEWAERNVKSNPHVSELIEIRRVVNSQGAVCSEELCESVNGKSEMDVRGDVVEETQSSLSSPVSLPAGASHSYGGPPVLLGVVKEGEKFDFCMCNPPFFETMEEAGLNPKTSCGGTQEEMVCPGGENAFITQIIEDSAVLKDSFRWYTSMVGRKTNLKSLTSKLREIGATIVKTTEFVQGHTCRWGLAWSFLPPLRKMVSPQIAEKTTLSFMLEGLLRQFNAFHVLQSVESFFLTSGASCKLNTSTFTVEISASNDQSDAILTSDAKHLDELSCNPFGEPPNDSGGSRPSSKSFCFRISIFQQTAGTLLVKGSPIQRDNPISGSFSSIMQQLEETLRYKFCKPKRKYDGAAVPNSLRQFLNKHQKFINRTV